MNSAKIWGIKIEIYLTAEVPMGINIDQPGVQRNRYQMTPSNHIMIVLHQELFSKVETRRITCYSIAAGIEGLP